MNDSDRSLAIVAAICLASQLVTDDPAAEMWDAVQHTRNVARCFGVTPSECVTAPDGRPVIDALPWEDLRPINAITMSNDAEGSWVYNAADQSWGRVEGVKA